MCPSGTNCGGVEATDPRWDAWPPDRSTSYQNHRKRKDAQYRQPTERLDHLRMVPPAGPRVLVERRRISDVVWVSWGAPSSFPFPEIYRTDAGMAKEWKWLDVWGIQAQSRAPMNFASTLSQHGTNPVASLDDTPNDSWNQLNDRINCNGVQSGCLTWDSNAFRSGNVKWGF